MEYIHGIHAWNTYMEYIHGIHAWNTYMEYIHGIHGIHTQTTYMEHIHKSLQYFGCLPPKNRSSGDVIFFRNPLDEIYHPRYFPGPEKL